MHFSPFRPSEPRHKVKRELAISLDASGMGWIATPETRLNAGMPRIGETADRRPVTDKRHVPSFWACWTVSRFLSPEGRRPFLLRQALLPGSSDLPESLTERAAPPLLFGLAPHGVCPAGTDYSARGALLPHLFTLTRNCAVKR